MTIIMLGDVVGESGLLVLEETLRHLIEKNKADFTIVNGENAAGGFGLTRETLDRILAAGADLVTGGNHIWEKREFWKVMESAELPDCKAVLRPANYPVIKDNDNKNIIPGRGFLVLSKNGLSAAVINLQGRELMTPIDCPFSSFDSIFNSLTAECAGIPIIVDFHAESAEEKEALAYYLDGRASIVAGTHTHVQTADERILPRGTAYITDLGMTGTMNGIIGMDKDICMSRALTQVTYRKECSNDRENCKVQGIVVELDDKKRAVNIKRIN